MQYSMSATTVEFRWERLSLLSELPAFGGSLCTYQCKSRGGGGGSAGKGRGFDAWDYPRCRAFDRVKQPRGRDI